MKSGSGKAKGSRFEREVCKSLSLWVTRGEKADVFWRSALSGGRATVQNKDKDSVEVRQAGDICAVAEEGYDLVEDYYFELKHYKDLQIPQFFLKGTGLMSTIWRSVIVDAGEYGRNPILIAKQNNFPTMLVAEDKPSFVRGKLVTEIRLSHLGIEAFIIRLDELLCTTYRRRIATKGG